MKTRYCRLFPGDYSLHTTRINHPGAAVLGTDLTACARRMCRPPSLSGCAPSTFLRASETSPRPSSQFGQRRVFSNISSTPLCSIGRKLLSQESGKRSPFCLQRDLSDNGGGRGPEGVGLTASSPLGWFPGLTVRPLFYVWIDFVPASVHALPKKRLESSSSPAVTHSQHHQQ